MSTAPTIIKTLFGSMPKGYSVEVRPVPGSSRYVGLDSDEFPLDDELSGKNWYFGVCPRGPRGVVDLATVIWCDVDGGATRLKPRDVIPYPTAIVSSGKGQHIYWALNTPIPVDEALRLTKLARAAYEGDRRVCEAKRVMRYPGSFNMKYKPPAKSEVEYVGDSGYDADELLEFLVAALVKSVWEQGSRHAMALGLGAILARASWEKPRAERVVKALSFITQDTEVNDRLYAINSSIDRHLAGQPVSAAEFKQALGDGYRDLVEALGITARDGDILADGVKIGETRYFEESVVSHIVGSGDYASGDGLMYKWASTRWEPLDQSQLTAAIFHLIGTLTVVEGGQEVRVSPNQRTAQSISSIVAGSVRTMLDLGEGLLPVQNGVLDVEVGSLYPHARQFNNRYVLPIEYDPTARAPEWERFIAEAAGDFAPYIQEWFGYSIVAGNPYQKMLWLCGESGTGKSTVIKTLAALLGDGAAAVDFEKLNDYMLAHISGKRVLVCSELSNRTLKTTLVKELIAGDPVQARHPYGKPFSFQFTGKMIWASNTLPRQDQTDGMWRRMAIVPFNNKPRWEDVHLDKKIHAELSGVLNWALAGLARLRGGTGTEWTTPSEVQALVNEYRASADVYRQFADEELNLSDTEAEIGILDVYQRFSDWAKSRGIRDPVEFGPLFWQEMKRLGLRPVAERKVDEKGRVLRVWKGASFFQVEIF